MPQVILHGLISTLQIAVCCRCLVLGDIGHCHSKSDSCYSHLLSEGLILSRLPPLVLPKEWILATSISTIWESLFPRSNYLHSGGDPPNALSETMSTSFFTKERKKNVALILLILCTVLRETSS